MAGQTCFRCPIIFLQLLSSILAIQILSGIKVSALAKGWEVRHYPKLFPKTPSVVYSKAVAQVLQYAVKRRSSELSDDFCHFLDASIGYKTPGNFQNLPCVPANYLARRLLRKRKLQHRISSSAG